MENYITLIVGLLGGGTIVKLLELAFTRKDKKNELDKNIKALDSKISDLQQNQARTEMLVMMNHYENETFEILRLAKKYFVDLKGDFTMTSIFAKYLKDHNIEKPIWFDENK